MIAVVDYGVGNLFSLARSLEFVGADCAVTRDPEALRRADRIILPGVGAFGDAARRLRDLGLDALLQDQAALGKPLLGICLGMQLLLDVSYEYGEHPGLGLIPGAVKPLAPALAPGAKVPHMGWNALRILGGDPLLSGVRQGDSVYYVHSYYATGCEASLVAVSEHGGVEVPGVVRRGNVCGMQFHPEKSGAVGLGMLAAFAKEEGAGC